MKPHYADATVTLHHGDCLNVLRELPDQSVDSVVTDPPYGLEFMGKEWDGANGFRRSLNPNDAGRDNVFGRASRTSPEYRALHTFQQWCELWAVECLRVLKPGGHLLAFGGTRTHHRLACAVEDAGFEIRDSIAWLYGSGFPKSLDVSKAIDKAAGAEREVVGLRTFADGTTARATAGSAGIPESGASGQSLLTAPATAAAQQWQGWGTALKPAFEPVVCARKPLAGTVAANVQAWGTGALNVDACRIESGGEVLSGGTGTVGKHEGWDRPWMHDEGAPRENYRSTSGRWPANVVLDEHQAAALDQMSGELTTHPGTVRGQLQPGGCNGIPAHPVGKVLSAGDSGGASRFYYTAKADTNERIRVNGTAHPTVKPLSLMRWLVRLVTPPGGLVLEPFAGSGTTVEACILENFRCIAIEREQDYLPLIVQRVNRQRDPIAYTRAAGEDLGLFQLFNEEGA